MFLRNILRRGYLFDRGYSGAQEHGRHSARTIDYWSCGKSKRRHICVVGKRYTGIDGQCLFYAGRLSSKLPFVVCTGQNETARRQLYLSIPHNSEQWKGVRWYHFAVISSKPYASRLGNRTVATSMFGQLGIIAELILIRGSIW